MTISIGDQLPEGTLTVMEDSGPTQKRTAELFGNRKVVLFGVPGAFTPSCHHNHMPGYVQRAAEIKSKGVDAIACLATNDIFVLDHWAEISEAKGKIEMLADGNADYVRALGLALDARGKGLGTRSQRFSMLVDDGKVAQLAVESVPTDVGVSAAEGMLSKL